MNQKQVIGIHGPGSNHWVGDGFPVRNLFPSNGVDLNPFLMLDYAGPKHFPPSEKPRGVGEHPHRGFETVTILYQGRLEHRDSSGSSGVIGPGDVQWMTAASGVVHEEMHEREFSRQGGMFQAVQLWVNLPRAHKMSKPGYQELASAAIPAVNLQGGATARVIAGQINGTSGPARTFTPIHVWDIRIAAGQRTELPVPDGFPAGVVLLDGSLRVNGMTMKGEALLAQMDEKGESISLEADTDSTVLLLAGKPIDEPVASYGPFVMNTEDEIRQAIADYRAGRMGRL